jgi:transcriptional regulator with XRE-family HTH domain
MKKDLNKNMKNQMNPEMVQSPLSISDICRKLRAIRQAQSLSLADVETLSQGRIKAVVLGSYERGSRALSVKRALEIAAIYHIPAAELFREHFDPPTAQNPSYLIDLRKLKATSLNRDVYGPLTQFCGEIQRRREDWNGEVISLRVSDLDILQITSRIFGKNLEELLVNEGILVKGN